MSNATTPSTTKVITSDAKLSYPHIHAAQAGKPGQKAKYSAAFVFAPGATPAEEATRQATLKKLTAAAVEAAREKFGSTIKGQPVERAFELGLLKSPIRTDALGKGYPEGSFFLNCRSDRQPGTVYAWPDPVTKKAAPVPGEAIKDVFYPGAIVRGSLVAFGYDTDGNKGVSFALNNIQFVKDGERLDGRVSAEDEFDTPLTEAPASLDDIV